MPIEEVKLRTKPIVELKTLSSIRAKRQKTFLQIVKPYIKSHLSVSLEDLEKLVGVKKETMVSYANTMDMKMTCKHDKLGDEWAYFVDRLDGSEVESSGSSF